MPGTIKTDAKVKEASVHAVVTRADGRVEDLGIVSYYHRNPLKRLWWKLKLRIKLKKLKENLRGKHPHKHR